MNEAATVGIEGKDQGLDKAIEICDKLFQLARDQRSAIVDDDVDHLTEMVRERNLIMSSLDLDVVSLVDNAANPRRIGAGNKELLIKEKIRDVLLVDEENKRLLQARLAEMKGQLMAVDLGRQALDTYAYLRPQPEATYIDRLR